MKIKINNILDKFLEKMNLRRIEKEDRGQVIKFETTVEEPKLRKGAVKQDDRESSNEENRVISENKKVNSDLKIKRQGIKILASMVLLLLLTVSLIRRGDNTIQKDTIKDVSSISASSNIDEKKDEVVLASKAVEKKIEKLIFCVPIEGTIQKMYSTDKVIYSKTLQQWKTHDGLDIAPTGSKEVKAIERGVIDEIYDDNFYGKTIVIEHISGYKSRYSNLDNNVYVSVGESVIKGQKIGKVGNTSVGEYLDDPHLHFMIFLNDESINPSYLYK